VLDILPHIYGFKLVLEDGSSAFFIPDVWRENPEWSANDVVNELVRKIGRSGRPKMLYYFKEIGVFT
ncbi:MAG: hypothetical protein ACK559_23880, partial [bacterium]